MKSVEIRSFFWSAFSSIWTEYEDFLGNTKIYYLELFTQCFCIKIYSFVCQYSLHFYWYCYNQKQSSGAVLQKMVFFQISQNSQKSTKKEIPAQMLSCEFCEISDNIFFKNALDSCFGRNTRDIYCPTSIQKRCHTDYLAEYFYCLICRLGTRVSSIFQALSHKSIFNPVEHLRLSFFGKNSLQPKTVKYFREKAPLWCSTKF